MSKSYPFYKLDPTKISGATATEVITLLAALPFYISPDAYTTLPSQCQDLLVEFDLNVPDDKNES